MAKVATKRVAGMARCRVCHRELRDAAHIAAGIGPDCARKAAARRIASGQTQDAQAQAAKAFYPRERYEVITRKLNKLVAMLDTTRYQWSESDYAMILRWAERWRAMQWQAYRMMTYGYRAQRWVGIRRLVAA